MICATPALSKADEQLSQLYAKSMGLLSGKASQLGQVTTEQRQGLLNHRNTCADPACLQAAYTTRMASLQAAIASLAAPAEAEASNIHIEAPLGGWRNTFGEPILYTQEVHYPASFV